MRILMLGVALAAATACSGSSEGPRNPASPCVVISTLSGNTFGASGGTSTATVSTRQGCAWSVTSDAWIVPSVKSGDGPATLSLTAAANEDGAARGGSITIAETTHAVTQAGCSVSLSTTDEQFSDRGEARAIGVLGAGACKWAAAPLADWIKVEPSAGAGAGEIRVVVSENNTGGPRVGAIDVNGQRATIRQAAETMCRYEVRPVEVLAMPLPESGEITIDTAPGCDWRAASTAPWVALSSPLSGSGPATIRYSVPLAHSGYSSNQERRAAVEVRWDAPTAGQNVWIRQLPTCAFLFVEPHGSNRAIDATRVEAAGGSYTLWTLVDPVFSCPWTARSEVPWIRVTYPAYPGVHLGDGSVRFVVEPNTTGAERSGRIMGAEKFLTVVQPAR